MKELAEKYKMKPYKFMFLGKEAEIRDLTENEKIVIILKSGMSGYKKHTLKEIGNMLNLSRERIRQILWKAMRRLRHPRRRNHPILKDIPEDFLKEYYL